MSVATICMIASLNGMKLSYHLGRSFPSCTSTTPVMDIIEVARPIESLFEVAQGLVPDVLPHLQIVTRDLSTKSDWDNQLEMATSSVCIHHVLAGPKVE